MEEWSETRVLLVEDDPDQVRLIALQLERGLPGVQLDCVESLAVARERIKPRPDLVLLDLGLPDADRLEAVEGLLAVDPELTLVILTVEHQEELAREALRIGAQDFVFKGVASERELRRAITFALERSRFIRLRREQQRLETLGLLASGIAHDLTNYLSPALLHVDMVLSSSPPEGLVDHLERIRLATERATGLARKLLSYAGRAEAREGNFLSPDRVVEEIKPILDLSCPPGAHLELKVEPRLPLFDADALGEILINLVGNACDAMQGREGLIELDVRAQGKDTVLILVRDEGCGMEPEVRERCFEPFYSGKPGGQGLGLSVVRHLVEGLSGTVEVESAHGLGTTFEVRLPAQVSRPDKQQPSTSGYLRRSKPRGTGTVLVVDDEDELRLVVGLLLGSLGFDVIEAPNGESALELAEGLEQPLVFALVDQSMTGIDGLETIAELRNVLGPELVTILYSGFMPELPSEGPGVPSGCLTKPASRGELLRELLRLGVVELGLPPK